MSVDPSRTHEPSPILTVATLLDVLHEAVRELPQDSSSVAAWSVAASSDVLASEVNPPGSEPS